MADNGNTSGSMTFLAFILGGLLIAVVVGGFFMFGGGHLFGVQSPSPTHIDLSVKAPAAPKN